jgi:hypothetical protein
MVMGDDYDISTENPCVSCKWYKDRTEGVIMASQQSLWKVMLEKRKVVKESQEAIVSILVASIQRKCEQCIGGECDTCPVQPHCIGNA